MEEIKLFEEDGVIITTHRMLWDDSAYSLEDEHVYGCAAVVDHNWKAVGVLAVVGILLVVQFNIWALLLGGVALAGAYFVYQKTTKYYATLLIMKDLQNGGNDLNLRRVPFECKDRDYMEHVQRAVLEAKRRQKEFANESEQEALQQIRSEMQGAPNATDANV